MHGEHLQHRLKLWTFQFETWTVAIKAPTGIPSLIIWMTLEPNVIWMWRLAKCGRCFNWCGCNKIVEKSPGKPFLMNNFIEFSHLFVFKCCLIPIGKSYWHREVLLAWNVQYTLDSCMVQTCLFSQLHRFLYLLMSIRTVLGSFLCHRRWNRERSNKNPIATEYFFLLYTRFMVLHVHCVPTQFSQQSQMVAMTSCINKQLGNIYLFLFLYLCTYLTDL